MSIADDIVDLDHLDTWLTDTGPALGLTIGPKGLPACWAQHPITRHEVTGLFLSWTALAQALIPPPDSDPFAAQVMPGPRDFLDLSNASAAAVTRAISAASTCARAGHHVADRA